MTIETLLDYSYEMVRDSIFGSDVLAGLWMLSIIFAFGLLMRLDLSIVLAAMIPATIVLMALGTIPPVAGGIILLLNGVMLAMSWWQNR